MMPAVEFEDPKFRFATTEEGFEALDFANRRLRALWEPPPDLTVSQWADQNRILAAGTTAKPGPWDTNEVPYLREIMDVLADPDVERVVVKKGAQVGWSEVLNNVAGYYIDVDPKPIMMVQPSLDDAKGYSKKRIAPMIAATPALRAKVRAARAKVSGNTMLLKEFPGGFFKLTGANSGKGLRSDAVAILLLDEVDAYPPDVDNEGSPIILAIRRTDTYPDRKICIGSTPLIKGLSTVDKEFELSDQRYFYVICPNCHGSQKIEWSHVDLHDPDRKHRIYHFRWDRDRDGRPISDTVHYVCQLCAEKIFEKQKRMLLEGGKWIPTHPGRRAVGYQLPAFYSPFKRWAEIAQEWHEAQGDVLKLKGVVNTIFGEVWEEEATSIDAASLNAPSRLEEYKTDAGEPCDVPHGVGVLIASVDVQDDRLECVVKGYGAKEESWLIAHQIFPGDPGGQGVWDELDKFLLIDFQHASGRRVRISACTIDLGGHHTDEVYKFCKVRANRHVWAVQGENRRGMPILGKVSLNNSYHCRVYRIGTDTAKDTIFSRLKIVLPEGSLGAPQYMHLPFWVDEEYLAQLTAEKAITKWMRGRGSVREYIKTRPRNEALDLEVYNLAALYSLGPIVLNRLGELAEAYSKGMSTSDVMPSQGRRVRSPGIQL